jgi:predicted metalloprotease
MAFWDKLSSRGNVEDRRGFSSVGGGVSLVGIVLIIAVNYFTGGNIGDVLYQIAGMPQSTQTQKTTNQYDGTDSYEEFASTVLGSDNDAWTAIFAQQGRDYREPKLVLFRDYTDSECGGADARVGPHYCPLDETIYLDETFFDELTSKLGARGGDVAQAYVISHEVGHHVQNQLGLMDQVNDNDGSVRLELQADCYAGIWANSLRDKDIFEANEIQEAIDAAAAVGDDRIQEKAQGYVNPETWTHGSSEQRMKWFTAGYNSGTMEACDTFAR